MVVLSEAKTLYRFKRQLSDEISKLKTSIAQNTNDGEVINEILTENQACLLNQLALRFPPEVHNGINSLLLLKAR